MFILLCRGHLITLLPSCVKRDFVYVITTKTTITLPKICLFTILWCLVNNAIERERETEGITNIENDECWTAQRVAVAWSGKLKRKLNGTKWKRLSTRAKSCSDISIVITQFTQINNKKMGKVFILFLKCCFLLSHCFFFLMEIQVNYIIK